MSENINVAVTQKTPINTVRDALEKMKPQFSMCLPRHLTPDRLLRVAMTAIQTTPKLLECDRQSLYSAIMKSAQLGLEPDGILGQAYLIPFAGKVQFIVGYKGLIDLARRSGEVSNIIAKEVCEKDKFELHWHKEVPFTHEQATSGDRGSVIGFWAMARFKDGGFHFDYMTVDEVNRIRDGSSGWKQSLKYAKRDKDGNITECNSPWFNHYNEQGKKTAIRRISKFLPMSVQRAAVVDELQEAGKATSINDYGEITIEGTASEVTEETSQQGNASKLDEFVGENQTATQNAEASTATLPDWHSYIEDINTAPTIEGVEFKFNEAAAKYPDALAALTQAKADREKALKPAGRKLFAKRGETA